MAMADPSARPLSVPIDPMVRPWSTNTVAIPDGLAPIAVSVPSSLTLSVTIRINVDTMFNAATTTISPEDCPAGSQKLEGCPPIGAIFDAEIAEIYAQRAFERDDLTDFDPVDFARNVDIPINEALIKFVGSTDEGALNAIAAKIWMIENAEHTIDVIYYLNFRVTMPIC